MENKIDSVIRQIEDSLKVKQSLSTQADIIVRIAEKIAECFNQGHKVWLLGNGGSAADAQHIAAELAGKFYLERKPLPAIALTTNTSVITAIGNDFGYEEVFVRQVQGVVQPGDIVIGISTSGNSPNVVKALTEARKQGAWTVALTGQAGKLKGTADECIAASSIDPARVQEVHITAGHIICYLVEKLMFAGNQP